MPAGSKRLPECSPIFSNCFVRSVSNCLSSSENASGDLDGRHLVQSAADSVLCQIWHNPEPSDKHISASPTKFYEILGKRSETFSKSVTVPSGNRVVEVHLSSANGWIRQTRQCEVSVPPGLRKQPRPQSSTNISDRQTKIEPVQMDLERRLPPTPEGCDCRHVFIGGHVVLVGIRTNYVYNVFQFELQQAARVAPSRVRVGVKSNRRNRFP